MTSATPQRTARHIDLTEPALVACDIDGTLTRTGHPVTAAVRDAVGAVRSAGHHIVLATGRSVVGALPVSLQLGLDDAWIVASNGAVTVHLMDGHYEVVEQHTVEAEAAIRVAVEEAPGICIAAEIVGDGYRVNVPFPDGQLNGRQHAASDLVEFWRYPTPRLALHGPEAYRLVPALVARNLTAIATRRDWVDVTGPGISKATALEKVRVVLGVEERNTVAIGDSENDVEMLNWAAHGWAMGHAPAFVIASADQVTGTIDDDGSTAVLWSLIG